MSSKKYTYNYDIEECNQLFKRGVFPIGCGKHDKTGNVFHVFCVNSRYVKVLDDIRLLASQGTENNRTPRQYKKLFSALEKNQVVGTKKCINVECYQY